MNDFNEIIRNYYTNFPDTYSFLGSPEEAQNISEEHKDQIHFLNREGTEFVNNYLHGSKMDQRIFSEPFKDYFSNLERFQIYEGCNEKIKKWLYNRGIAFDKFVFIDSELTGQAVFLTWKMVVKYWQRLFFHDSLLIFDSTFNWGLYYSYQRDELIFGTDKIFDKKVEEDKMLFLNQIISKLKNIKS